MHRRQLGFIMSTNENQLKQQITITESQMSANG